ncbi:YdcF family protein [Herbaspirillum sp. NPDC101397]|uniref:YdcF family protein n=1 Tax=Herbaspirillum sp. NPDC101397 TaxID=3364006 RepID=UPI003839D520
MSFFEFDATIVLANLMDQYGVLNDETRSRLEKGCLTITERRSPVLITCGWNYRPDSVICIADAMRTHAVEKLNLSGDKILTEKTSRDTVGDAVFTKKNFALPQNWRRILVVTSAYHASRTQQIFEFIYGGQYKIQTLSAPSEMNEKLKLSEAASLSAFMDTFHGVSPGDDAGIFDRLVTAHPFYNGQIYSKIDT